MNKYLEGGKIINIHGIKGALKVEPWTDTPAVYKNLKNIYIKRNNDFVQYAINKVSIQGQFVLLSIDNVTTPEEASLLKNIIIYIDRSEIVKSESSFFIDDLINLDVIDYNTNVIYGKIVFIYKDSRYDTYEIKTSKGNVLLPAVKEYVKQIDIEKGVYITPIPGFFDEN